MRHLALPPADDPVRGDEYARLTDALLTTVRETLTRKNHDYTAGSGDPFANFRLAALENVDPLQGLMIRCQDKFQRLRTFIQTGSLAVHGEGWRDAILDVIGYMTLLNGMMTERERMLAGSNETDTHASAELEAALKGSAFVAKVLG
jgi:hypothetical protein